MSNQYHALLESTLWKAVDTALADLERNKDIELRTARALVVGYVCQLIRDAEGASETVGGQFAWVTRGKTLGGLIKELKSFEDQSLEVRISVDGGATHKAISLVGKRGLYAVLSNDEIVDDAPSHTVRAPEV
jgi:hypothetical protein